MSKTKLHLWSIVIVFIILILCVFTMTTLPELWFKNHLNENWNISEKTKSKKQQNRLCLIIALDGVPYEIIKELYAEGYFKGFYPPGRLVSTFPSLTRPAFSKMLIGGKPFGFGRLHFNSQLNRMEGFRLSQKLFSTKKEHKDYNPKLHFLGFPGYIAYVFPDKFTQTALSTFHKRLLAFTGDTFIAYIGLSDPIAHVEGKEALIEFLKKISIMLDTIRNDLGILLDVVLFSDHANNLITNQRVKLGSVLEKHGYNDVEMLVKAKDFVLPRNGFVSFASLYTNSNNAQPIAEILSTIQGIDLAIFKSGDSIMVRGPNGFARISKKNKRYRYTPIDGDPLKLKNIIDDLKHSGEIDNQGFIQDNIWWEATKNHVYPDPLRRIWESMNDLVQHPGTILVSFMNGYAFGPPIFSQTILGSRAGTHGALLGAHSNGVYMTDFMKVAAFNRPDTLVEILAKSKDAKRKGKKLFPFMQ